MVIFDNLDLFATHNLHLLLTNITLKKTESYCLEKIVPLPFLTSCVCSPEEIISFSIVLLVL